MLFDLTIGNYFVTWKRYFVGASLDPLEKSMIGTVEGYLVGLSLGLPIGSPFDSPNTGLTGIIICMSLGNPLGYLIDYIWHIN